MYETLPYTESFDNFGEIWFPRVCSVYNQGQNFVGKFTKLSKIHDFLEYFAAFFSQFFSTTVKNWLLGSWLRTFHQFHAFEGFFVLNFLNVKLFENS